MVLLTLVDDVITSPGDGSGKTVFDELSIRLTVGGVELLGWEVGEGLPLDPLDMARWGLLAVREAAVHGRGAYDLGEYGEVLLFKLVGRDILVHSTMRERTASAPYDRLAAVWSDFADRVRVLLRAHVDHGAAPDWESWPAWEAWLDGAEAPILPETTRFVSWFTEREGAFARIDGREP